MFESIILIEQSDAFKILQNYILDTYLGIIIGELRNNFEHNL